MDNTSSFNSNLYDSNIRKVIPYYDEIYKQIFDLIHTYFGGKSITVLDTGCGSGNFGERAIDELNIKKITMCDPSESMLAVAKDKLKDRQCEFRNIASEQLDYHEEYDLVVAIQSHHYLSRDGRKTAVENCYKALKAGGLFICFENTASFSEEGKKIILERVERYGLSAGRTQNEVKSHSKRYNSEYFPITAMEHIDLLKSTGFSAVEIIWYSYMQGGYYGIK